MLMAWNNRNLPLHNGVPPPFLYGKGFHNHWIINEAVLSEFRLVFDASRTISCFSLNYPEHWSEQSGRGSSALKIEKRSWEDSGNSHLGAIYGWMFFHEINYTVLVKLLNCEGKYIFADITEDTVYPSVCQTGSQWTRRVLRSFTKRKNLVSAENVKSQNRILNCSLRDQLKSSGSLDFPFSLESLLSITADKNKTIVLAIAGYSYKDMLISWVCRLRLLQVTNFIICALDHETYQFSVLQDNLEHLGNGLCLDCSLFMVLNAQRNSKVYYGLSEILIVELHQMGLPVFHDPSTQRNTSFDDCHFGTACFQRVTKVKSRMVWKILKLGYNVLLSDVDVYWFGNPLPLLYSFRPGVLVAQLDEYNDSSTVAAMEKVVEHAATSNLSEQPSFYDTLCGEGGSYRISDNSCVEPETNLTVHFLDRNLFPDGAYLNLWQKKNVKKTCMMKGCLVLHNNWISGRMKKLDRRIVSGSWEPESKYTDRVQKKLTLKHTGSVKFKGFAHGKDEISDVNITWDPRLDISEESVGSAREFYTSKDRWPRYKVKRSFRGSGWEPSLNSRSFSMMYYTTMHSGMWSFQEFFFLSSFRKSSKSVFIVYWFCDKSAKETFTTIIVFL
ncbi:hypothetical protein POTOM_035493 [Populus tomentosa]|uniref:Nucleotide-diphospho-sugar transferase domain-containing protein n=1 Tax=Populus tomentosa TaxID=118781 RepID=A0A8X7YXD5_POPTO|nr:hypothetical protein POTOM_035493 [Populus tomentosa]